MARLEEVGERDGWRCWICDEPVDPDMSVNDPRGPSVDSLTTPKRGKAKGGVPEERLAHRACNTKKGAVAPVVPWGDHLFVVDPAPIVAVLYYPTQAPARMIPMGPFNVNVAMQAAPEAKVKGLILLSHGTRGTELGHASLAEALARLQAMVDEAASPSSDRPPNRMTRGPQRSTRKPEAACTAQDTTKKTVIRKPSSV